MIDPLQIKIEEARAKLPVETLSAIAAVDFKKVITDMRTKRGYTFEQLGDLETETELLLCGLVSTDEYPKELQKRLAISQGETENLVKEMDELVFKKIREEFIKIIERKKVSGGQINIPSPTKPENSVPQMAKEEKEVLSAHGIHILTGDPKEAANLPVKKETLPVPDQPVAPSIQTLQTEKLEIPTTPEAPLPSTPPPAPLTAPIPQVVMTTPSSVADKLAQVPQEPKTEVHPMLAQKLGTPFQTEIKKNEYSLNNILEKLGEVKPAIPDTAKPKSYPPKADPYRMNPEE